ncbi:MAG TPA: hypothetical protein VN132_07295, partial [Bdellovibrio sp.]|nr:hypothetical protein [Bdellovibrio sp.]
MRFHKNNSSALLKIFLSVSLFFSSTYSFASVENEAWIYFTKHFPEQYNQSPNLMSLLQEVNLNLLLEDKTYFKQVDELNLKRSKVTFQGNRIVLIDDKAVVWIELKNAAKREFLINGRTLFYDVNKPIIQQLAVTFKEKNQTSKSERWLNLMLNQVWAVEPATVVGLALENSGSEALGTTLLARGALAGGAAVAGSAVAARAAAIIAAAAAVAGGLYCGGRAVSAEKNQGWNEFLNCASTPLSWMGVNPRDTLQVKELNCKVASTGDLAGVEIRVESSRGEIQKRTFSLEKGTGLRKVEIQ